MDMFDLDIKRMVRTCDYEAGYKHKFTREILSPMFHAYTIFKGKDKEDPTRYKGMYACLDKMPLDSDWRIACNEWVARREKKWIV